MSEKLADLLLQESITVVLLKTKCSVRIVLVLISVNVSNGRGGMRGMLCDSSNQFRSAGKRDSYT